MKDKSLVITLIIIFGLSGVIVIMLGWFLPALQSDRIIATLAGLVGIGVAAINVRMLRKLPCGDKEGQIPVNAGIEDKS